MVISLSFLRCLSYENVIIGLIEPVRARRSTVIIPFPALPVDALLVDLKYYRGFNT
jgi:hypothetical protein